MKQRFVLFDTETTGLTVHPKANISEQPYIIEFGALITDGQEIIEEFNVLIKPPIPISDEITKITGITDSDLVGAPSFAEAFADVRKFFDNSYVAVAHNLPFDKRLVQLECIRNRFDMADFWPHGELCTSQTFTPLWGRMPRLIELYEWTFDKPLDQTHRAIDDVKAMFEIFKAQRLADAWNGSPV